MKLYGFWRSLATYRVRAATPRVRIYLEREMQQTEEARNRWAAHWTMQTLRTIETLLAADSQTGRFCHGDAPTLADICLASQVIGAVDYFNRDMKALPAVMRIHGECMQLDAFASTHPFEQPGAPARH